MVLVVILISSGISLLPQTSQAQKTIDESRVDEIPTWFTKTEEKLIKKNKDKELIENILDSGLKRSGAVRKIWKTECVLIYLIRKDLIKLL